MREDDKMRAIGLLILLWVSGGLVQGCEMGFAGERMPKELAFELLAGSLYADGGEFTSKGSKVLRNSHDYNNEFIKYSGRTPPEVDFSKNKVLLLDMGFRKSGGYFISVVAVKEFSDTVGVEVLLTKPAENCVVTNAFTNPYQFVRIPTTKEILVSEEVVVKSCRHP